MTYIFKKSTAASLVLLSVLLFGCVKDNGFFKTESGDPSRKQIVKIINGNLPIVTLARDVNPTIDTFMLVEIRREPSTQAELNSPLTVTVIKNSALISSYNTANSTNFVELPAAAYTMLDPLVSTITFQPGEFAKTFRIRLDKSQISLSNQYALGFSIAEVGNGGQISAEMKNILVSVGVKNKYDGIYRLKGYHNRDPYNFPYDQEMHMITNGPSSVIFYWPAASSNGHPIGTGPDIVNDVSWYGAAISPVVVFDLNTNVVTNVFNNPPNATPITRFDGATGSNVSRYDPATKTIIVHWNYNNNPQRAFFDTLTYTKAR